ncbi:MAG: potassium transporter TrkG [Sphaerochaetaceae bacterium]|nr:potassium transporter TrkG [Sphaerochaetaceae bacterium]MDC7247608.1 potassium transporter TrkG [Sphaerochaetaceae bacterium]
MNWKPILRLSGTMQGIIGIFMLIPTLMAAYLGEWEAFRAFIVSLAIIAVYLTIIFMIGKNWRSKSLSIRDVYLFVSLTWIVASALGGIPLFLTHTTKDYTSAFMEIMSGFTTTGLTTLSDIEASYRSVLFWRSLTHWLGGMGIVVLFVALLPLVGVEGFQLFGAEAVGPTKSKLTPKIKNTALILWLIYLGMTLLETLLLRLGGLPLYDALTVTFGTVATGGFVTKNASIGFYNSAYVDVVVTIFMVMAGVNFSLYFALIRARFTAVVSDIELRVYLSIFFIATMITTIALVLSHTYATFPTALRYGAFHVASILTTTGYATTDYGLWPSITHAVLMSVMFIGGSAGSTGGGIKVTRWITMFKVGVLNIKSLLHPKGIFSLQTQNERIPWKTVNSIAGFVTIYIALVLVSTIVVASAGYNLLSSFAAALISVGNIGLGLDAVGPAGTGFGPMPSYVKWFLSLMMLAGRLEIYTVFSIFTRTFWRR